MDKIKTGRVEVLWGHTRDVIGKREEKGDGGWGMGDDRYVAQTGTEKSR